MTSSRRRRASDKRTVLPVPTKTEAGGNRNPKDLMATDLSRTHRRETTLPSSTHPLDHQSPIVRPHGTSTPRPRKPLPRLVQPPIASRNYVPNTCMSHGPTRYTLLSFCCSLTEDYVGHEIHTRLTDPCWPDREWDRRLTLAEENIIWLEEHRSYLLRTLVQHGLPRTIPGFPEARTIVVWSLAKFISTS